MIESPIPVPNDAWRAAASAVEALEEVIEFARVEAGAMVRDRHLQSRRRPRGHGR